MRKSVRDYLRDEEFQSELNDIKQFSYSPTPVVGNSFFGGEKFVGGMDIANLLTIDYYTLRTRSRELYIKNPYAKGLIDRIVLSKISTGLTLESQITDTIGDDEAISDLSNQIERNFNLWGSRGQNCDYYEQYDFNRLMSILEKEALLGGDCLIVLHFDKKTGNTKVQLVPGEHVKNDMTSEPAKGNRMKHGVELDKKGKQVAYHVKQTDGKTLRVPAYGRKSGRRLAWMYYAAGQRELGAVRGTPLLGIVMQTLQGLDKYKDSKVLTAQLNANLAMWIEKTEDRPGSKPISGGAVRKDTVQQVASTGRDFNLLTQAPGQVFEELAHGEKIKAHQGNQSVEGYRTFEEAIIDAIAWTNQIPPEILKMSFNSNYSASQAAKLEFSQSLRIWRETVGKDFCQPVYEEWLLNQATLRKINLPLLVASWRDKSRIIEYSAWVASTWTGTITPTVDILKNFKAYELAVNAGLMTYEQAIKEATGKKSSAVFKRLSKEIEELKDLGILTEPSEETEETEDEKNTD